MPSGREKGLQAAGSGAFGGSRYAEHKRKLTKQAQQLALAQAQAFEFAQGAEKENWDEQLQAAQGIGNLGIAGTQALGTLGLQKAAWRACSETIFA